MKRFSLLVLAAVLAVAVFAVGSASAVEGPRTELGPPEKSINLVLAGSPGDDRITIELSADGRSYEIDSAKPLQVASSVCSHPEKVQEDLVCEAAPIAGFEVNTGAGNDSVVMGRLVPVPATIRGGEGDDVLVGGPGNDILQGGPGQNPLVGGPGKNILE